MGQSWYRSSCRCFLNGQRRGIYHQRLQPRECVDFPWEDVGGEGRSQCQCC